MLKAENLSQKVYGHLKEEIYSGQFPTRGRIAETQIADRLGVSRTPVREAVRMLENEGLIESLRGGGVRAFEITSRDIEDAFAMRAAIETVTVRLAAQRSTREQGEDLDRILARARQAARTGRVEDVMRENEQFHLFLAHCTGSRLMSQLLVRIYDYIKSHRLLQRLAASGDVREIQESIDREHSEIAEAVKARDASLAVDLMYRHLEGVSTLYKESLNSSRGHEPDAPGIEEETV